MNLRARFALLVALVAFASWSIAGMQLAALALLVALVAGRKLGAAAEVRAPVFAFAGICAASVLLSPALGSFDPWAWRFPLLVWLVAAAAQDLTPRAIDRVAGAWIGAMALASIWGIVQAFTGLDLLTLLHLRSHPFVTDSPWAGHFAALGFFNSRITFANALLVPLALAGAWAGRGIGRARTAAILAVALIGGALVLTFTRAAWWGALLALGILLWRRGFGRAAVAFAFVAAIAFAVPAVRARFSSGMSVAANADRVFIWQRAREVISDHPVLGVGFGGYARIAEPYYDRVDPTFGMHTWAHDTPLSLLAETGPTGVAAYFWLWIAVYLMGLRAVRSGSIAALGLFAGTLAVHVASLFHDVLYDGEVAFALYIAAGLLVALGARAPASTRKAAR
jgi:O-antigen ligase